jgi:hypothetical protein
MSAFKPHALNCRDFILDKFSIFVNLTPAFQRRKRGAFSFEAVFF